MASILIVDDSKYVTLLLKEFALKFGHTPILASDGQEGLRVWNNNTIDLVITDVEMPKMTGLEFLKEINGKTKVIVITGDKEQHCDEAMSLGALEVLEKPIRLSQFKELMDRYT